MKSNRKGNAPLNVAIAIVLIAAVAVAIIAILRMDPRGERESRTGRDYARNAHEVGRLDPALVTWTETAAWPIAMDTPVALARSARGEVYVLGDRLVVFGTEGTQRARTDVLDANYRALTMDAKGRIYAVTSRRVDLLALDGAQLSIVRSAATPDDRTSLAAVAVTEDGVYVADASGCRVFRLPHELIGADSVTPSFEVLVEKLVVPSVLDLAVSPEGELVTVDPGRHTVQVRDVYGDVVRSFGKLGFNIEDFHGCCNPAAIVMTPDGYTVTAEKGMGATRIKVYDGDGELESIVAGPSLFDELAGEKPIIPDVACDAVGRVLVLDPRRKQVRVFTRKEATDD